MYKSPTRFLRYSILFKFPGPSSPGSNLFCASRLSGEAPSNPTGSWAKFCYAYGVNEMLHTCYLLFSLCHLSFVICHAPRSLSAICYCHAVRRSCASPAGSRCSPPGKLYQDRRTSLLSLSFAAWRLCVSFCFAFELSSRKHFVRRHSDLRSEAAFHRVLD